MSRPRASSWYWMLAVLLATAAAGAAEPRFGQHQGCVLLLEVSSGQLQRWDRGLCGERLSPCSTYKILNALIALETGAVEGLDSVIAWDGVERGSRRLDRDHDLESAIRNSIVWYFQQLARRVGERRMRYWLAASGYGNQDISGGLERFWLGSSLLITPEEQLRLLVRLRRDRLPFSPANQALVRQALVLADEQGVVLRGKTGSHRGGDAGADLGWFVGWLERSEGDWIFVTTIRGDGAWGAEASRITGDLLTEHGLL